jgi:hypothetical protein
LRNGSIVFSQNQLISLFLYFVSLDTFAWITGIRVEEEFQRKENNLKCSHDDEIKLFHQHGEEDSTSPQLVSELNNEDGVLLPSPLQQHNDKEEQDDDKKLLRQKRERIQQKREKARQQELHREALIREENAAVGPTPREIEINMLLQQLSPHQLTIQLVDADGHCLYRAIAEQCNILHISIPNDGIDCTTDSPHSISYRRIRHLCAATLRSHADTYGPFCEYNDEKGIVDFETYVNSIESSAEWGGHLELRLLSKALQRLIFVYRSHSVEPLVVEEDDLKEQDHEPIRLSYHLRYYALGEHYNHVVRTQS